MHLPITNPNPAPPPPSHATVAAARRGARRFRASAARCRRRRSIARRAAHAAPWRPRACLPPTAPHVRSMMWSKAPPRPRLFRTAVVNDGLARRRGAILRGRKNPCRWDRSDGPNSAVSRPPSALTRPPQGKPLICVHIQPIPYNILETQGNPRNFRKRHRPSRIIPGTPCNYYF